MAASSSARPNNAQYVGIILQKAGRHRSYALLIAFLIWSSHIHEPQFWEAIISPIRNEHLEKDGPCELLALEDFKEGSALRDMWPSVTASRTMQLYLNAEFHLHA